MKLDKVKLKFIPKLISTHIKENKKTADSIVETIFESECITGDFKQYNKQLEDVVFNTTCWENIKCGEQAGEWELEMVDPTSGEDIAIIKPCVIKNIVIKASAGDIKVIKLTIVHNHAASQPAIEAAISTMVSIRLGHYTELLPGTGTADIDSESNDKKSNIIADEFTAG